MEKMHLGIFLGLIFCLSLIAACSEVPKAQKSLAKHRPVVMSGGVWFKRFFGSSSSYPTLDTSTFGWTASYLEVGDATLKLCELRLGADDIEPQNESIFPPGLKARRWNNVTYSIDGNYLNQPPRPLTLFFDENGVLRGMLRPFSEIDCVDKCEIQYNRGEFKAGITIEDCIKATCK